MRFERSRLTAMWSAPNYTKSTSSLKWIFSFTCNECVFHRFSPLMHSSTWVICVFCTSMEKDGKKWVQHSPWRAFPLNTKCLLLPPLAAAACKFGWDSDHRVSEKESFDATPFRCVLMLKFRADQDWKILIKEQNRGIQLVIRDLCYNMWIIVSLEWAKKVN